MSKAFAVIFAAAGQSSRFKMRTKKPFTSLAGRPVWLRAAEPFVNRENVIQSIICISPSDMEMFKTTYGANLMFMNIQLVEGGKERHDSIAHALAVLKPEVEFVAIHDAVRPCITTKIIDEVFAAAVNHGAAIPALPVTETLKKVDAQGQITGTTDRAGLWQAQTPQVFRRDWLEEAYHNRDKIQQQVTDDAQLLELFGKCVVTVHGSAANIKITYPEDLVLAENILKSNEKSLAASRPRSGPFDEDWMK